MQNEIIAVNPYFLYDSLYDYLHLCILPPQIYPKGKGILVSMLHFYPQGFRSSRQDTVCAFAALQVHAALT